MGIEMKMIDGLHCPVVICDHCGKQIEDAKNGNYEWQPADESVIFFTHKQCCLPFERDHGGRGAWYAMELQVFPIYLGSNLTIDWEDAKERARRLAEL